MLYQSLYLPLPCGSRLHLMSINKEAPSPEQNQGLPILMVHGMVEDGRIFYHPSGKGLGSYLAQQGYQVYVADLRGIGKSTPKIGRHSQHGQTETICQDLPALIDFVLAHSKQPKLHLAAHSWGGVYLNAMLVRFPHLINKVICGVYFGSKRRVRVKNFDRLLKIEFFWNRFSPLLSRSFGYLPAKKLKFGADNETLKTHRQCVSWVRDDHWRDSDDNFDYGQAAKNLVLPPIRYFAAIRDFSLGHRSDVKLFMSESCLKHASYQLLSKKAGNKLDYDHLNMLTAAQAVDDHFPRVLQWLQQKETKQVHSHANDGANTQTASQ